MYGDIKQGKRRKSAHLSNLELEVLWRMCRLVFSEAPEKCGGLQNIS